VGLAHLKNLLQLCARSEQLVANRLKPLSAGALRQVADIEVLVDSTDGVGTPTTNYVLFASNVRFEFADWRVTENQTAKEIQSSVLTYITMRWRPGITSKMRIKHIIDYTTSPPTSDYYDVQGVVRDTTLRDTLQLACMKRDAAGYRIGATP